MESLDLRGVSCPMNYVQAKLKLEVLDAGQELELLLSDGEPILNVPKSAKEDGNEILKVEQVADYFKVLIKKG